MNPCYMFEIAYSVLNHSTISYANVLDSSGLLPSAQCKNFQQSLRVWSHLLWWLPHQRRQSSVVIRWLILVNHVGWFTVIAYRKWEHFSPPLACAQAARAAAFYIWMYVCGKWAVRCISKMTTSRSIVFDMSFVFIVRPASVSSCWEARAQRRSVLLHVKYVHSHAYWFVNSHDQFQPFFCLFTFFLHAHFSSV